MLNDLFLHFQMQLGPLSGLYTSDLPGSQRLPHLHQPRVESGHGYDCDTDGHHDNLELAFLLCVRDVFYKGYDYIVEHANVQNKVMQNKCGKVDMHRANSAGLVAHKYLFNN